MVFCANCGTRGEGKYCIVCGHALAAEVMGVPVATTAAPLSRSASPNGADTEQAVGWTGTWHYKAGGSAFSCSSCPCPSSLDVEHVGCCLYTYVTKCGTKTPIPVGFALACDCGPCVVPCCPMAAIVPIVPPVLLKRTDKDVLSAVGCCGTTYARGRSAPVAPRNSVMVRERPSRPP
jgi:hypothetical protein